MTNRLAVVAVVIVAFTGCHQLRYGQDVSGIISGGTVTALQLNEEDVPGGQVRDGVSIVHADVMNVCVTPIEGGSIGTPDTDRTDNGGVADTAPPSDVTVACMLGEVLDDPEDPNDGGSFICDDPNTVNDCRLPDGSSTFVVNNPATNYYRAQVAGDSLRMRSYIENVRDYMAGSVITDPDLPASVATGAPTCIGISHTFATGSQLRRLCLQ